MSNFFTDVVLRDPRYTSPKRVDDLDLLEPVMREVVQCIVEVWVVKGKPSWKGDFTFLGAVAKKSGDFSGAVTREIQRSGCQV